MGFLVGICIIAFTFESDVQERNGIQGFILFRSLSGVLFFSLFHMVDVSALGFIYFSSLLITTQ